MWQLSRLFKNSGRFPVVSLVVQGKLTYEEKVLVSMRDKPRTEEGKALY